nr:MAG TPA: hypothetical protein [Caudoviricetes sp.]
MMESEADTSEMMLSNHSVFARGTPRLSANTSSSR